MKMSKCIAELERISDAMNQEYWQGGLQSPMIIVRPATRPGVLGTCSTQKIWILKVEDGVEPEYAIEITMSGEYLDRDVYEICTTLQHEKVHQYHSENDIVDCNLKIHNKKFKKEAERVGLHVEKGQGVGLGVTTPTEEFKAFIDSLNVDMTCFDWYRLFTPKIKPKKKRKYKYTNPENEKEKLTSKIQVVVTKPEEGVVWEEEVEEGDDD